MVKTSTVNKLAHGMQNNINCICVCVCFLLNIKNKRKKAERIPGCTFGEGQGWKIWKREADN